MLSESCNASILIGQSEAIQSATKLQLKHQDAMYTFRLDRVSK